MDGGGLQAAVPAHIFPWHCGNACRRAAELLIGANQLSTDRILAPDHVIAVDDNEGIIAGEGLGGVHSMAQTQRLLLAHKEDVCHVGDAKALFQSLFLAGLCQLFFQLRAAVKVILNDALVAAQNDEDIGDAGTHSFFHQILDGRLVHNGEHLLGHGLCGGQHAGAQACRGDDGFTDLLHGKHSPLIVSFLQPYRAGKT